jgi:acetoin utilization deacetylase AcuC-like enzyme
MQIGSIAKKRITMTLETMTPIQFKTYLHPQTTDTSHPRTAITFTGFSLPYFDRVRTALASRTLDYPSLPLATADIALFQTVHSPVYLDAIKQMAADQNPTDYPCLSSECSGMEFCLPGYAAGLGGLCAAIDQMKTGNLERAYCFSLGGHHAFADWGHGYCLLNPLAAAIRYAQQQGFCRVLMLDWDIHHGDGTQAIFANDSSVYCISIHSAFDLYMAKMSGLAVGTTTAAQAVGQCNIPVLDQRFPADMPTRLGLEGEFYMGAESIDVFATKLASLPWKPDFICIFSGYDAHQNDCGYRITDWQTQDFERLTQLVLDLADTENCPVLSVHGGGYKLEVAIATAQRHIHTLATYRHKTA